MSNIQQGMSNVQGGDGPLAPDAEGCGG